MMVERNAPQSALARVNRRGNWFRPRFVLGFSLILMLWPGTRAAELAGTATNLPASADLRPVFEKWGLPIRSQGSRGTCSVFTMTGAIEFALASRHQAGTALSVEFLNWAANEARATKRDGGFFAELWAGFERHGICAETNLPYQPNFDVRFRPDERVLALAQEAAKAQLRLEWIKPWNVKTGLTDEQFQAIKRTLTRGWPVCAGLRWPKHAEWKQNVLQMAPAAEVFDGHSVLLVGFKDDPAQPGGGVLLIRNSGAGPADGAMPYDYARACLNDAAWIQPAAEKEP
jgi:hypothetical protein